MGRCPKVVFSHQSPVIPDPQSLPTDSCVFHGNRSFSYRHPERSRGIFLALWSFAHMRWHIAMPWCFFFPLPRMRCIPFCNKDFSTLLEMTIRGMEIAQENRLCRFFGIPLFLIMSYLRLALKSLIHSPLHYQERLIHPKCLILHLTVCWTGCFI